MLLTKSRKEDKTRYTDISFGRRKMGSNAVEYLTDYNLISNWYCSTTNSNVLLRSGLERLFE